MTLASIGHEKAISFIQGFVKDNEVGLTAIFALTQLGDKSAFDNISSY